METEVVPFDKGKGPAATEAAAKAFLAETGGWYESCYLWSVTSMASYSRAMASARHCEETLFFC